MERVLIYIVLLEKYEMMHHENKKHKLLTFQKKTMDADAWCTSRWKVLIWLERGGGW